MMINLKKFQGRLVIALSFALYGQVFAQPNIQPSELQAGGAEPFWGLDLTAGDDGRYQAVFTQAAEPPNDKIISQLVIKDYSPVNGMVFYHGMTEDNKTFSVISAKITCLEDGTGEKSPLTIFVIWDNQHVYQGCSSSGFSEIIE